jgi:hypothetical protein
MFFFWTLLRGGSGGELRENLFNKGNVLKNAFFIVDSLQLFFVQLISGVKQKMSKKNNSL